MLSNNRDIYVGVMEEQREHNAVNFPLFYLLNISNILLCMLQSASGNQAFYFIPFLSQNSSILSKYSSDFMLRFDLISANHYSFPLLPRCVVLALWTPPTDCEL